VVYEQIRRGVYRYGRDLDVTRWRFHFENGSAEAVLEALSFYQNEDGGFGHGLEYDCMNPNSLPVQFFWGAAGILREIDCYTKEHPMMQGIIHFLENSPYVSETGCRYNIPSNNEYPCCPWCLYSEEPRFPGDWAPEETITAEFVDFALAVCEPGAALHSRALKIIDYRLSIMPRLRGYLAWNQSNEWQALEPCNWVGIIRAAERSAVRTSLECQALYDELLSIVKAHGLPHTYDNVLKNIQSGGKSQPEDLDAMIDRLADGPWREGGLRCTDPKKMMDEMCSINYLWWPIKGAISDLIALKEHGRLER